jgi:hypothetical protein
MISLYSRSTRSGGRGRFMSFSTCSCSVCRCLRDKCQGECAEEGWPRLPQSPQGMASTRSAVSMGGGGGGGWVGAWWGGVGGWVGWGWGVGGGGGGWGAHHPSHII